MNSVNLDKFESRSYVHFVAQDTFLCVFPIARRTRKYLVLQSAALGTRMTQRARI